MTTKVIDLTVMPTGARYENTYGEYLNIFQDIATTPANVPVKVIAPPAAWVSLLLWLDCEVVNPQVYFEHDAALVPSVTALTRPIDRTIMEGFTTFRPETVHALYLIDMLEWNVTRNCPHQSQKEFIITNNGSYHRKEILDYITAFQKFTPKKRKVVIVPCAADKPYPSPLHKEVLARIPDDYYMLVSSGAIGFAPEELWPIMPLYDAGLPYDWRLMNAAKDYFGRTEHDRIISYCDYSNPALYCAFNQLGINDKVDYVTEIKVYADYLDLMKPELLAKLEDAFKRG